MVRPTVHGFAVLVMCRLPLVAAVLAGSAAGPALASPTEVDGAIGGLLAEDPPLSELVERDPDLLDVLRAHPELAARLAVRPNFAERVVQALTNPWILFGLGAQFLFMMRFLVQWIASERQQRSYVPVIFWYFSIGGGLMLLTYAIQRRDPVFILGQSLGLLVYTRNLVLIYRRAGVYRALLADRAERQAGGVPRESGSSPDRPTETAPAT